MLRNISPTASVTTRTPNTKLIETDLSDANLKGAYLDGADLEGANLEGADLSNAIFWVKKSGRKANNITPDQIKEAKNWEKATYSPEFREELGLPPSE